MELIKTTKSGRYALYEDSKGGSDRYVVQVVQNGDILAKGPHLDTLLFTLRDWEQTYFSSPAFAKSREFALKNRQPPL